MAHPRNNGQIVAKAGPVAVGVVGASALAASGATLIVATGGAAALVLAGYGVMKWLSNDSAPETMPDAEVGMASAKTGKPCPSCGHKYESTASYCEPCGVAL